MTVTSKRDWLKEGLALLEEAGAGALTIETLTKRFNVTKGSFYHHFKNVQDFKEQLLTFYAQEQTHQVIQVAERETSPRASLESVLRATLRPSQLEVAMRAWAFQDEFARDYQERRDRQRLAYLTELISAWSDDQVHAARMARLFYSIYIGSQHMIPPVQGVELAQLYQEALPLLRFVFETP
ncbi:MAG TPA: TetR/AcrR family transcriptional regulator [Ktedonobacteraceae bacterium]